MNDAAPSRARRARHEDRPAWSWLLPALSILAAAGIPLLIWYAWDAIANSTDGDLTATVTDPAAPGYQAFVLPSPSFMVLSLDPTGDLSMVTLLSLASNDQGGNVLNIAPETRVDNDQYDRVIDAFRDKGAARTRRVVAELIGINVDEMEVLDSADWSSLLGPVGAIGVDIDEDLVEVSDGATRVVYSAGNISVEPGDVAAFLGWVNPGAHPAGRLDRAEAFWRSWIATIAASSDPAGIVPGEVDSGIGRFVSGLARAEFVIAVYETIEERLEGDAPAIAVDPAELRLIATQMVPFPLPATAGARPEVRLLDGVGGTDLAGLYSPVLVGAGAQIVVLGNAATFEVAETEVIYHDASWEDAAFNFSAALGGADVTFEPITDVLFDITVIIGDDQELAVG